jgi:hypothetical protein
MHTLSHEDTMIASRPRHFDDDLNSREGIETPEGKRPRANFLTRTRTLFRAMGEQMSSFELSRQIYG